MARSSGGVFDMRNVLLEKKSKVVNETKDIEMASLISHMSSQSIGDIDHLRSTQEVS